CATAAANEPNLTDDESTPAAAVEHVGHEQRLLLLTHELLLRLVGLPVAGRELRRLAVRPVAGRELRRLAVRPVVVRELRRLAVRPVVVRELRPLAVPPVSFCDLP